MNMKNVLLSGLIAGAVMAVLSNIPFVNLINCLLCAWLWSGGILAAWLYRRFDGSVTTQTGAAAGVAAGVIGGIIGTVLSGVGMAGYAAVLDSVRSSLPPETAEMIGPLAAAGGFSFISLCINLMSYAFFGAIGGLIGGAIFKSKASDMPQISEARMPSAPVMAAPMAAAAPVEEMDARMPSAPEVDEAMDARMPSAPEVDEAMDAPKSFSMEPEEPPAETDKPDIFS